MKTIITALFVICMWGCKENSQQNDEYETTVEERRIEKDSVTMDGLVNGGVIPEWATVDTIDGNVVMTADSHVFNGKYELPVGKVQHTIPIKLAKDTSMGGWTVSGSGPKSSTLKGGTLDKFPGQFQTYIDTIPKKDSDGYVTYTIPLSSFESVYMGDRGIDPPPVGLEAPRYDYFYCEREVKAIRKELDSLKIEIQKLKSKQ